MHVASMQVLQGEHARLFGLAALLLCTPALTPQQQSLLVVCEHPYGFVMKWGSARRQAQG